MVNNSTLQDVSAIEGHNEGNSVAKELDNNSLMSPLCDMIASMVRLSVDKRIAPAATSTPAPIARTGQRAPLRTATLPPVARTTTHGGKESAEDEVCCFARIS